MQLKRQSSASQSGKRYSGKRHCRGFTLIELMITIVVIGILAAIAYPSYNEYVSRARRAEAVNLLLEVAAEQEAFFSDFSRYATHVGELGFGASASAVAVETPSGNYAVTIAATPNIYIATAAAQNAQVNDACLNFSINQVGIRGVSGAGMTVQDCW